MDPLKLNPRPSITDLRPVLERISGGGYARWGAEYCCLFHVMRHPEASSAVGDAREQAAALKHADCIEACDMLAKMTHSQRVRAIDLLSQMHREKTQPDAARE